jgi:hypothetical protein
MEDVIWAMGAAILKIIFTSAGQFISNDAVIKSIYIWFIKILLKTECVLLAAAAPLIVELIKTHNPTVKIRNAPAVKYGSTIKHLSQSKVSLRLNPGKHAVHKTPWYPDSTLHRPTALPGSSILKVLSLPRQALGILHGKNT